MLFLCFVRIQNEGGEEETRQEWDRGVKKLQMLYVWSETVTVWAQKLCPSTGATTGEEKDTACAGVPLSGLKLSGLNLHLLSEWNSDQTNVMGGIDSVSCSEVAQQDSCTKTQGLDPGRSAS